MLAIGGASALPSETDRRAPSNSVARRSHRENGFGQAIDELETVLFSGRLGLGVVSEINGGRGSEQNAEAEDRRHLEEVHEQHVEDGDDEPRPADSDNRSASYR